MDRNMKSVSGLKTERQQETQTAQSQIVEQLKRTLADEYMLQIKTQNFHWNVEGPLFFSLHKLFEEQYNELAEFVDRSAEVVRSLKARAPGSFTEFQHLSMLSEVPAEKTNSAQMIETLTQDHEALAEEFKERLEAAESEGQISAVTLYEDLISFHEKAAWMIRSHRS